MEVRSAARHDVSPLLRDLAKTAVAPSGEREEGEEVRIIPHPSGFKPADQPDPVLQTAGSTGVVGAPLAPIVAGPTLLLNFDGIGQGVPPSFSDCCAPPDTNGAVGLTQYVQWVNSSLAVFNKSDGSLVTGFPINGNLIWKGFGGDCETHNNGDPIVVYDKLADRWILTQLAFTFPNGPFSQCAAVSTSSDATGSYNRYQFGPYTVNNAAALNDYPKLGLWPDAYYITYNMFGPSTFLGTKACAWDRNAMLSGAAATEICFQQASSVGGVLPSDMDGHTPPPPGSPNYMLEFDVNSLNLYKFHVDFTNPSMSSFSPATNIPVAPFTPLCASSFNCVPQQGTTTLLDSLGDRLMYRLAYRNFGDHESLVANHSVAVTVNNTPASGVRWYEIQSPAGTPVVAQQSTFAPDANFRWMGSVAMDQAGDVAVGYSVSSSAMFPSIAVAARLASDPPSSLQSEIPIQAGAGSQIGLSRWGDYSAMQVDPVDDCTFWFTTEYLKSTGSFNWNTRINTFKFDSCDKPDLTIVSAHTGNFTQGDTSKTYTITVKNSGGQPTNGTVTVTDAVPAGLTINTSAASGTGWSCSQSAPTVTCTRPDSLAPKASFPDITLTVDVSSSAPGFVTNTATVAGGGEQNTSNDTSNDVTTVIQTGPDPTIAKTHSGSFIQGQTGTYTITVTNVGLADLDGTPVTVTDTPPTGLTLPASAATGTGWSCSQTSTTVTCTRSDALKNNISYPPITLTVNVASNAPAKVTNTATVSGGGNVNTLNDTANDATTIIPPPPDLSITKTHIGNFNQGQFSAAYTLTVSNAAGTTPTSGTVTVTDTLPTGLSLVVLSGTGWPCFVTQGAVTCSRSDALAPGNSYQPLTLLVNVANDAPASVDNVVTVSGGGDITPGNNSATDHTIINPSPDLTITKTHTDPFTVGQTGVYTITVTNSGHAPTSGQVTVNDSLPFGLVASSFNATGWTCSGSTFVGCTRSDALAAGSSYPAIAMTVNVAGGGPAVTNFAGVMGGGEFNNSNDTASDPTTILAPRLTVTKSHVGNFTVGQSGTYTIVVGNNGAIPTIGTTVTMSDFLPAGLTATAITAAGWNCPAPPTTAVVCSRSDVLPPNSTYPTITLAVSVDGSAAATVFNNVTVTGGGDSSTHFATDPTNINVPDLAITKTHNGNFIVGQTGGVFTISVSNVGAIATAGGTVTVTDFLPFSLTATAASGVGWNCNIPFGQQVSCTQPAGTLPPGNSYSPITVTVNVGTFAPPPVTNQATVSGIGDANPGNNTVFDTVTVLPAIAITPTSATLVTVSGGSSATFSFNTSLVTNPPVGTVTFSTSSLPPNCRVTFNPTSLTQTGSVTMTWDTSGNGHVASLQPLGFGRWSAILAAVLFAMVGSFAMSRGKKNRNRSWLWTGMGVFGLALVLVFVGCGGGSIPPPPPPPVFTPPGTYTINVTATGSNGSVLPSTTQVTLIVK